jgi:hypothetical protein
MNISRATRLLVGGKTVKKMKKIFTVFPVDQPEATIFFTVFQPTNQKPMTQFVVAFEVS